MNKLILHIILTLCTFSCFSQDLYDHELNESKWQDLRDNIKYQQEEKGTVEEDSQDKEEKEEKEPIEKKTYPPLTQQGNSLGLNWLGWCFAIIVGAAIIGFIIYIIQNNDNSSVKSVNIDDYFENTPPADIPLTELERKLKEMLEQSNFRGAVRIYYLFILKDLSLKQWVDWEKDKTNMHYLREMDDRPEFDDFNKAISYFEVIWYGKRQIDQVQFETVQPFFTIFLQKLGVK